jgi:hypothetical protein
VTPDAETTGQRHCGCCGRRFPAARVAELGVTPGVFICARCAVQAALRAGLGSVFRGVRLPRRRTDRGLLAARTAIPILPCRDLDRTATFYAPAGFAETERYEGYLLLNNDAVELHFSQEETVHPGTCFVHVTDVTAMWKHLRHLGVTGAGDLADQDYGLREFVLTDPDGNRIRFGSPRPDHE